MTMISILCPSRERPTRFADMVKSALSAAASVENIEVVAYLDMDDPERYLYELLPRVNYVAGPRLPVSVAVNALYKKAAGEIVLSGADDTLFRTAGWDQEVINAFAAAPNGVALAVPLDGAEAKRGRRTTHMFASRAWVSAVGYFLQPKYEHFYADTHLEDIARQAGALVWLDSVLLEHMHPNNGKGPKDATHAAKRQGEKGARMSDRDKERFESLVDERKAAAARVREARGA